MITNSILDTERMREDRENNQQSEAKVGGPHYKLPERSLEDTINFFMK